MSLGDRLRDMLDPGAGAPQGGSPGSRRPRGRSQAQPVNSARGYEAEPDQRTARAQWIVIGLAAALAVALTAGLVFAILTITRPGEQARATPTPLPAAASPTPPLPISAIFATFTPTPQTAGTPTATPPAAVGQRLEVANTGGDGANMRREPGQAGERVKTLVEGTVVEVIGTDREVEGRTWRNVRDAQGDSGWIISTFLVPEGTAPPPVAAVPGSGVTPSAATPAPRPTTSATSAPSRGQVGNTSGQGANIRSEPGSSGRVLKTLPEGATVEVLGQEREVEGRVWRLVRDSQGVTGWMIGGAVVPPGTVPTPTPGSAAPAAKPTAPAGPTQPPAATKPAGTPPAATATPQPAAKPTAPSTAPPGGGPIIFEPATPRPTSSPATR